MERIIVAVAMCYSNGRNTSRMPDGGMGSNQFSSVPDGELASVKMEIGYIIAHQAHRMTACPP